MKTLTPYYSGSFFSFEGIDGAGKSTHIQYFSEELARRFPDKKIILTREPGGTPLGEKLRQSLLNESMDIRTEALLMFASRQEHLSTVIEPALIRGDIVISDRFTDSSFAYQCGGRGLSIGDLDVLEKWVQTREHGQQSFLLEPQLTFLFDLSAEVAQQRRSATRNPDKFEELDVDFFNRVRNEYLRRASQSRERFVMIDSSQSIQDIQQQLKTSIAQL
ncbi:MAG: dTMP kinase [Betaproteobacteria bacterium]|jgi:dTMP kinase